MCERNLNICPVSIVTYCCQLMECIITLLCAVLSYVINNFFKHWVWWNLTFNKFKRTSSFSLLRTRKGSRNFWHHGKNIKHHVNRKQEIGTEHKKCSVLTSVFVNIFSWYDINCDLYYVKNKFLENMSDLSVCYGCPNVYGYFFMTSGL